MYQLAIDLANGLVTEVVDDDLQIQFLSVVNDGLIDAHLYVQPSRRKEEAKIVLCEVIRDRRQGKLSPNQPRSLLYYAHAEFDCIPTQIETYDMSVVVIAIRKITRAFEMTDRCRSKQQFCKSVHEDCRLRHQGQLMAMFLERIYV